MFALRSQRLVASAALNPSPQTLAPAINVAEHPILIRGKEVLAISSAIAAAFLGNVFLLSSFNSMKSFSMFFCTVPLKQYMFVKSEMNERFKEQKEISKEIRSVIKSEIGQLLHDLKVIQAESRADVRAITQVVMVKRAANVAKPAPDVPTKL